MRSIMLGCACAVVLAVAGTASAHEHMYIGSDQPHRGMLVLSYDFARKFPLSPNPTGGGFLGEDPAYNAQVTDDPADGIYRLKNHTLVKMRITAIDPGVSVGFAKTPLSKAVTLTKQGDTAIIGRMPYLHVHPEWLLQVPAGVTGDFHLSFQVFAAGYRPSVSYAATMTNVPPPTTTTTTLPGQTCAPGSCDDHDPCTDDSCVGGACQNVPVTGVLAVQCRMVPLSLALGDVVATTAAERRVQNRLFKVFNAISPALSAVAAGGSDAPRKIRKAENQLNKFATIVDQGAKVSMLDPTQADSLRTLAGNVYDQLILLTQ
jgi:hypothetical protein